MSETYGYPVIVDESTIFNAMTSNSSSSSSSSSSSLNNFPAFSQSSQAYNTHPGIVYPPARPCKRPLTFPTQDPTPKAMTLPEPEPSNLSMTLVPPVNNKAEPFQFSFMQNGKKLLLL